FRGGGTGLAALGFATGRELNPAAVMSGGKVPNTIHLGAEPQKSRSPRSLGCGNVVWPTLAGQHGRAFGSLVYPRPHRSPYNVHCPSTGMFVLRRLVERAVRPSRLPQDGRERRLGCRVSFRRLRCGREL